MKSLKIIITNNMLDGFDYGVEQINKFDCYSSNIILVPDRFSLNAEKRIFDVLNRESVFNIDIMSFNRLSYKVLNNKLCETISKQKGIMLINKIILSNKDKLTTFSKLAGKTGLAENIYETIMQFKSSGIQYFEIENNDDNSHLSGKLHDLSLIYKLYEQYLNEEVVDESNRLKMLANQIKNSDFVKDKNFVLSMFDSFTYLQLQVIKEIAKCAQSCTVCISANTTQKNSNIYVNETLQKVLELCRQNNIQFDIKNVKVNKNVSENFLKENIFSINCVEKQDVNNITIYQAKNKQEEIEFVAKKIKELIILKNIKLSDINICVGNLADYRDDIVKIFNTYGLQFYLDENTSLSSHYFPKFILNICELYFSNFELNSVLNFIKSEFVKIDDDIKNAFENYCLKYGIWNFRFLKPFVLGKEEKWFKEIENLRQLMFNLINDFVLNININNSCENYISSFVKLFNKLNIEQNLKEQAELFDDLVQRKNTCSIYEKVMQIFNDMQQILGYNNLDFKFFYEMLKSAFDSSSFSNIPMGVNTIFIGDSESSYFYKEKVLFILNAVEGIVPSYKNDCGIITDKEILKLKTINILSPSIKEINKRAKFKLFNTILNYKEHLFVTYSILNNDKENKPSELIQSLKSCCKNLKLLNKETFYNELVKEYGFEKAEVIFNSCLKNSLISKINIAKNCQSIEQLKNNIDENIFNVINYKHEYIVNSNLITLSKNTSISRIENFNTCPFKFYCQYLIKIKKNEVYGMQALDVGLILHSVAEKFVNYLIQNKYEVKHDLEKINDDFFNDTLSQLQFEQLDKNSFQLFSLKEESLNLIKIINKNTKNSKFKPVFAEYRFKDFKLTDDVLLTGVVDRVDEFENYFNILDYKTGKDKFSYAQVFTGKKLQLLVYLYVLEIITKKHAFGCFYFPISNKFEHEEDCNEKYKLSGIYLNSLPLVKCMDTNLEIQSKSEMFSATIKKDGQLNDLSLSYALSQDEFNNLKKYAVDMLVRTTNNIKTGNIKPLPIEKTTCTYCEYSSICQFNCEKDGYREMPTKISKKSFMLQEEE